MATRALQGRVTALEETVAGLQNLPIDLAEFRRETNVRFEQVERRIREESEQLYARMRMLHEELIDRIRIGWKERDGHEPGARRQSRRRPKR
jgi:hypothetical protein